MDYEQILVYILGAALFVLLVLSIVVISYVFKLVKSFQAIAEKAEHASDNLAALSDVVRKTAVPASAIGVLKVLTKEIIKHRNKEK